MIWRKDVRSGWIGHIFPDGKWMIIDTYTFKGMPEQKMYLIVMGKRAALFLGRFHQQPEFAENVFWRCDIHYRWSSSGNIIGFDSIHSRSRQEYIFRL